MSTAETNFSRPIHSSSSKRTGTESSSTKRTGTDSSSSKRTRRSAVGSGTGSQEVLLSKRERAKRRRMKLSRITGPSKDILMMYVRALRIDNISDDEKDTMLTSSAWNIVIVDVGEAAGRGSTTTKSIRIEGKQPVENSSEVKKTVVEVPMAQLLLICERYPTLLQVLKRIRPRDPKGNRLYKQLQGLARGGKPLTEVFSKTILKHISVVKGSFMVYREPHMAPRVYKHRAAVQEAIRQRKILEKEASTVMQSVWRMYIRRSRFLRNKAAATVIANYRRCVNARRETQRRRVAARKLLEYNSATLIQAIRRGAVARWNYKLYKAAQRIQAEYRFHSQFVRYKRYKAAEKIQACYRGHAQYVWYKRYKAAEKIQACYRGHVQYVWYKRYKSARRIQALYRGFRTQKDFARTKQNIIKIQTRVRMMIAKAELHRRKFVRMCARVL